MRDEQNKMTVATTESKDVESKLLTSRLDESLLVPFNMHTLKLRNKRVMASMSRSAAARNLLVNSCKKENNIYKFDEEMV